MRFKNYSVFSSFSVFKIPLTSFYTARLSLCAPAVDLWTDAQPILEDGYLQRGSRVSEKRKVQPSKEIQLQAPEDTEVKSQ